MLRTRFNYPDLDVLDSPLVSPSPLTSFTGVPGSALAERIFNDPDSWEDTDGEEGEYPEDVENDTLAWLTEEIEKFRAQSAGVDSNGAFDRSSVDSKSSKSSLSPATPDDKRNSGLKGISRKSSVRPISLAALFEHSNEDFSVDIQQHLSKILETGGIPHQIRPRSLSSALSPPSTSDSSMASSSSSVYSPLQIQTASSVISGHNATMDPSPVVIYSASTTLSFLEWYGIYPDTPLLDASSRKSIMQRKKSVRQKTPALHVPSPRHLARPSSLLSITPSTAGTAETFRLPPPKRNSSVPPPGLDPPSNSKAEEEQPPIKLTPPSPFGARNQKDTSAPATPPPPSRNDSHRSSPSNENAPSRSSSNSSQRGRPLPTAAPPPYTRTPSPPSPPASRQGSSNDIIVRRLPSIPPESRSNTPPQVPVRASPPPQPQAQPQPQPRVPSRTASPAGRKAATPAPASTAVPSAAIKSSAPAFASFSSAAATTSIYSPSPLSSAVASPGCLSAAPQTANGNRPPSSIRSPLGGPAGPRIRSRGSQDAGLRAHALPIGRRPPVLRL